MKNLKTLIFLFLIGTVLTSCGGRSNQQSATNDTTAVNAFAAREEAGVVALDSADRATFFSQRTEKIRVSNSGANLEATFVDPQIPVNTVLTFFHNINQTNTYDGVRLMHGLKATNKIIYLISAENVGTSNHGDTLILDSSKYTSEIPTSNNMNDAKDLIANYWKSVVINANHLNENNLLNNRSIFISWKDIIQMLSENIQDFNENDPKSYEGYFFVIENGYIEYKQAQNLFLDFKSVLPSDTNDSTLAGHTTMLYLLDKAGKSMINGLLDRSTRSYNQRVMGTKLPCPATCP